MSGGYQCRWCDHRAVVPSLLRDHETECPNRPKESA